MQERSSNLEYLRSRFRAETAGSRDSLCLFGHLVADFHHPSFRNAQRQLADATNYADPLGDANSPARIEQIEDVRTLENLIVSRQNYTR